jgi:DNA-directed RNA polymerase specialized sigma24 family protein
MHEDFRALFHDHATRVVRLASLLGAEDPEDVAQEAFCRLYEKRYGLRGPVTEAGPYLNRTVVNLVRDRYRRATTQDRLRLLSRRDDERLAPSAEDLSVHTDDDRRVVAALAAVARLHTHLEES